MLFNGLLKHFTVTYGTDLVQKSPNSIPSTAYMLRNISKVCEKILSEYPKKWQGFITKETWPLKKMCIFCTDPSTKQL